MTDLFGMEKSADLSPCLAYRWALTRIWDRQKELLVWGGLNASTADHEVDDPTIRREINFTSDWGYGGLIKVNLFGLRATDPRELMKHHDPVGSENKGAWQDAIQTAIDHHRTLPTPFSDPEYFVPFVCAWGAGGRFMDQDLAALEWLSIFPVRKLALEFTKGGDPRHPLYIKRDAQPSSFYAGRNETLAA